MTENDVLLTDRESAKMLHMSVSTFRRHVTNGSLPKPLKFGFLSRWLQSILSMSSSKQNSNVVTTRHKKKTSSHKDGQGFLNLINLKITKYVL
ncbi:putative DNA-binding transcriptional regulator AlpA [Bartonella heixiaziensis]